METAKRALKHWRRSCPIFKNLSPTRQKTTVLMKIPYSEKSGHFQHAFLSFKGLLQLSHMFPPSLSKKKKRKEKLKYQHSFDKQRFTHENPLREADYMVSNSQSSQKNEVVIYLSCVKTMPELTCFRTCGVSEVFSIIQNASGTINRRRSLKDLSSNFKFRDHQLMISNQRSLFELTRLLKRTSKKLPFS